MVSCRVVLGRIQYHHVGMIPFLAWYTYTLAILGLGRASLVRPTRLLGFFRRGENVNDELVGALWVWGDQSYQMRARYLRIELAAKTVMVFNICLPGLPCVAKKKHMCVELTPRRGLGCCRLYSPGSG